MLEVKPMGTMGANCHLYYCNETKKAALVDPGAEADRIFRWVQEKGVKVEYILLTHGHLDHIGAVDELRDQLGAQVGIHSGDSAMLTDARKNMSSYFGSAVVLKPADILLQDGQVIMVGKEKITVLATPGHSLGSVCFLTGDGLISGDTLFAGSIGRTDFPGGSLNELLNGVTKKLLVLPEETRVYPGHGENTTIGKEKRENPFLT
ncbi:MAG: MBL fold metallo-hydrolase [Desulfitobacterium hafniense]|nr:MBL fold metallo-hydrolase [Desulfitobacterium hafniense]